MANDTRLCFYPSGHYAEGLVPCSSAENAPCCGKDAICLSNGLCLSTHLQPYVLSRGGCTSNTWGSGCGDFCTNTTAYEGTSLINLQYYNNTATYCCGTPVSNGTRVICPNGNEMGFEVPTGKAIYGRALLSNRTETSSAATTTVTSVCSPGEGSSNSTVCPASNATAVGIGVGVSLGVVALASIIWAIVERTRATRRKAVPDAAGMGTGGSYWNHPGQRLVELAQAHERLPELDTSSQPSELPSRHGDVKY
ncbi:uncharacterized protein N7459_007659 [Penicillium hispanicum]|uniref:uncharacterized protein n=1 Tax=Penicillium hispanicum TaxID=1080232 RepID=UPI0025408857|nr:uncharacterized protein N7459_007659 [Penicillium hispanicum]KAJ5578695.1 hypothetical protein N7459_007659 [Penicillium hispanicum]